MQKGARIRGTSFRQVSLHQKNLELAHLVAWDRLRGYLQLGHFRLRERLVATFHLCQRHEEEILRTSSYAHLLGHLE
jgi:hypothetical protein